MGNAHKILIGKPLVKARRRQKDNTVIKKIKAVPLRHAGAKERGISLLLILDFGTRWSERSASRPGRALLTGKGPRVYIG
jgi:hypothetical protein